MFNFKGYREPADRLADYLPWAALITPSTVAQKDGSFLRCFAFRGPDLAASSAEERVSAAARANEAFKRLGSGWALFTEARRRPAGPLPAARWPTPASHVVDLERRWHFKSSGAYFESDYVLSIAWKLPPDVNKRVTALFYDEDASSTVSAPKLGISTELEYFDRTLQAITDILRGVLSEFRLLEGGELLTYLKSTISPATQQVTVPEQPIYLDALLPDCTFEPGEISKLGDEYLSALTVRGLPSETFVGMLDALNQLRFPYRWMTRFVCLDKSEAESFITKVQAKWFQQTQSLGGIVKEFFMQEPSPEKNPGARNKGDETKLALAQLSDDTCAFGFCTATVVTWNKRPELVPQQLADVRRVIQGRGFVTIDESHNALEAWLGTLPGHTQANVRRPMIHTQNLAHMVPLNAMWLGDPVNANMRAKTGLGHAHVYCSSGGSSYRLNLNPGGGDLGNAFIAGPPGSGKSVLAVMLALQWLKYPGARVILYDLGRSARAATLANASVEGFAQYFEPGNPRAPLAFQPLRNIDDPTELKWAAEFVQLLLSLQNVALTPDGQQSIDAALEQVAGNPDRTTRTLGQYSRMLGTFDRRLGDALRPYTRAGVYGQIFDAGLLSDADARYARWRMYEMGSLMELGEAAIVPALKYLSHCDQAAYDGSPTLRLFDECWRFMGHETFAAQLRSDLKTLRKKNVFIVFATQELADAAAQSGLVSTIMSTIPTKIFGADPNATAPEAAQHYRSFGLATHELQILASLQPKRQYYYQSAVGRRVFSLDLGPAALALVGASGTRDQQAIDDIVATQPVARYAEALFTRRGVDWAAKKVRERLESGSDREARGSAVDQQSPGQVLS